ncbi:MAG: nicotinamide riboside transporter PnuC [Lachnospiraceae bacterium]|nr:nicotinamide riboside transporter PnuC [Lachnospiraceae bacterium]
MNFTTKSQNNNKNSPYFKKREIALWSGSVILILLSFLIFDRSNGLTLIASLIGVTSLIFCAKGNPVGQVLMILFSVLYGIISYGFAYYGEMITYLGMTLPTAAAEDVRYISVVVCFIAFLVNDLYGYISWKKMEKRQGRTVPEEKYRA